MTKYHYSTKIGEKDASAVGRTLPISTKQSIEICTFIRGKKLDQAKAMLDRALNETYPIPFKRFTDGVGHRKGNLTSGRYPKNACTAVLSLLNSAQANAQFKGLSSSDLVVSHISAQKGSNTWKYGRRRRKAKNTTVEVVLSERVDTKKAKSKSADKPEQEKKEGKVAETPKAETKKEEKTAEKKEEPKKAEEKKPKTEGKKEEKPPESKKSESPKTEQKQERKAEK